MRAVIQRVRQGSVTDEQETVGGIGCLLTLYGNGNPL